MCGDAGKEDAPIALGDGEAVEPAEVSSVLAERSKSKFESVSSVAGLVCVAGLVSGLSATSATLTTHIRAHSPGDWSLGEGASFGFLLHGQG